MQRQIDQNIDFVVANKFGNAIIGEADDVSPAIRQTHELFGKRIRPDHIGVAEDFKLFVAVFAQQREDIQPDNVPAEIGGDVSDAQRRWGSRTLGCGAIFDASASA